MDRADAMRLLQALADAGMHTRAPRTNAWIEKKALEIGLEGGQFVSALGHGRLFATKKISASALKVFAENRAR